MLNYQRVQLLTNGFNGSRKLGHSHSPKTHPKTGIIKRPSCRRIRESAGPPLVGLDPFESSGASAMVNGTNSWQCFLHKESWEAPRQLQQGCFWCHLVWT